MSETESSELSPNLLAVEHDPFQGAPLTARLPLTEAQREIWLACAVQPEASLAYNEANCLTLRGPLDVAALLGSLQILCERHEVLRATFSPDGEWMCLEQTRRLDVPVIDISADPAGLKSGHEQALVERRFDLERGPLVVWTLLRESAEVHHLLRSAHHIIIDGWSSWVLSHELGQLYSALSRGKEPDLPPAPRYGDYAQTEKDFYGSAEGRKHLDYWLTALHLPPNALHLPHDRPRPAMRTFDASRFDLPLDQGLVARLRKLGATSGASLVATTLAAFGALLHRLSGQEDMIVGLAAAGQSFHEQKNLVGHAVNLLPVRLQPHAGMRFTELLGATRGKVLDAFDHQGVSFGAIVPRLKFERDAARTPLVPVMFNIDVRSGDVSFEGLEIRYETIGRKAEIFELFINMVDDGTSLVLECSYNSNLFSADAIRARLREYESILTSVCDTPEARLADLGLITPEARRQLDEFNRTGAPRPTAAVHEMMASQALRTPAAVAIRCGEQSISYADLERRAQSIAARLAAAGARAGTFVGVCLARTGDLPATLLGVLKTGAAYLPLDPDFPSDRLRYYLDDARAVLLVTDATSGPQIGDAPCPAIRVEDIEPAEFDAPPRSPGSAAYVIYTSGSTGKPKGVVIPDSALGNFLASLAIEPGLCARDVLAAVTTVSFDIAGLELWLPLTVGATVVLIDRDSAVDGERLRAALERQHCTVMQATPATWRLLLAAGWEGGPHFRACCGGEPLPRDLAKQLLPRVGELWNLYGPTETTIWSTLFRVTDATQPILIGRPIANTQCHVLDKQGHEVPPGVTGELWIGGDGLALGYHERAELTAEKFVSNSRYGRIYGTGDLARLTPGGLECLGRIDFQVKLRGYRIELGEIEFALNRHASVADCVCAVRERAPGDARLVAWLVAAPDSMIEPGDLRDSLRQSLPAYMIPQTFHVIDRLPRLPNGKLDRKSLPDPFREGSTMAAGQKLPLVTATQHALRDIWASVLGIDDIGADDRFLDLGGHSLLAVQAAARVRKTFAVNLPLRLLMMNPLAAIAQTLERDSPVRLPSPPAGVKDDSDPPPAGQAQGATAGPLSRIRRWLAR